MPLVSPTGLKVTNKRERREKMRERKKTEHSFVFISPTLEMNDKKRLPRESYSLASHGRQQRALPRAKVTSIVFINPAGLHLVFSKI